MFCSFLGQVPFGVCVDSVGDSSEDEPIEDPQFMEEHKQWVDSVLKEPMSFTVWLCLDVNA